MEGAPAMAYVPPHLRRARQQPQQPPQASAAEDKDEGMDEEDGEGDEGDEGDGAPASEAELRRMFWNTGMAVCPRCDGTNIGNEKLVRKKCGHSRVSWSVNGLHSSQCRLPVCVQVTRHDDRGQPVGEERFSCKVTSPSQQPRAHDRGTHVARARFSANHRRAPFRLRFPSTSTPLPPRRLQPQRPSPCPTNQLPRPPSLETSHHITGEDCLYFLKRLTAICSQPSPRGSLAPLSSTPSR